VCGAVLKGFKVPVGLAQGIGTVGKQSRVPVRVAFGVQIRIAQYLDKVGTYLERGLLGTCRYRAVGR